MTQLTSLSPLEKDLLEQISIPETVDLLQGVIRQRSDYPPGDCRQALQVIEQLLPKDKLHLERRTLEPHQPNLLVSYPPHQPGRRLVFHAHIDTVPAGDPARWTVDPFGGEVREGYLYGRGAGDDKASVVAQVLALLALVRARVELKGTLQVTIVSDEESGGLKGTYWLRKEGYLKPDALVVGEQTNNHIALGERVACGIDLIVHGKSAHGATPWAGENAVLKTARALAWLQEKLFPILEERRHPYLPPPTLNVGRIQGGTQWNIVPDWCKVEMDRRLLPGENRQSAMDELRFHLDEFSRTVEPLHYELSSSGEVAANIDTPPEHPFAQLAAAVLEDLTGEKRPFSGYVQTSDGRWFASDGIPILIFGPGDPLLAHAPDECVAIDQVVEAARFLALLAMRWLNQDEV